MTAPAIASPADEGPATRAATVLAARARALARPATAEHDGDLVALVLFSIGGVRHALEAVFVREVLREPPLSKLPESRTALVGVTNVRGEILAVADISGLLGVAPPPAASPVIVIEGPGPPLGLVADEVHDFVHVPAGSVAPLRADGGGGAAVSLVLGVAAEATVLSAAALLGDPRLSTTTEPRSGL